MHPRKLLAKPRDWKIPGLLLQCFLSFKKGALSETLVCSRKFDKALRRLLNVFQG